jgi:hypothetical protein
MSKEGDKKKVMEKRKLKNKNVRKKCRKDGNK